MLFQMRNVFFLRVIFSEIFTPWREDLQAAFSSKRILLSMDVSVSFLHHINF